MIEELTKWIDRLQLLQEAMVSPDQFGQEALQDFLAELSEQAVIGNVFRMRMDTGHAVRFTLEMCLVEGASEADDANS